MGKTQHQFAFTLAEVLITLSIIGVVAALTIPSLTVKNQEKQIIVQLKKTYSTLSNAYELAVVDHGDPSNWGLVDSWIWIWDSNGNASVSDEHDASGGINATKILGAYMNVMKYCGKEKGFWSNVKYKTYKGSDHVNVNENDIGGKMILSDGTSIEIFTNQAQCNMHWGTSQQLKNGCGTIRVDLNGSKGPNQWGKDGFAFVLTKYGIVPMGLEENTAEPISKCKSAEGMQCTAWALLKENMDYPDSW